MKPHSQALMREFAQRYATFIQSLTGIFALALDANDVSGARALALMTADATSASNVFLEHAIDTIRRHGDDAVVSAAQDTGLYDQGVNMVAALQLQAHIDNIVQELTMKIRAMLATSVAALIGELRKIKLSASLGASTASTIPKVKPNRVTELKFMIPDGAGRKWKAADFFATTVSKAILQLYVESFIFCLAEQGETHAKVVYPNPQHANHGLVFSIADDGTEFTFEKIRDAIWHPNSSAEVERVHS